MIFSLDGIAPQIDASAWVASGSGRSAGGLDSPNVTAFVASAGAAWYFASWR